MQGAYIKVSGRSRLGFPSERVSLTGQLERVIRCRCTLALAANVIGGSSRQEPTDWYFPGDDLFTPSERRRGLPLGNQTSQFFANVYFERPRSLGGASDLSKGLRPLCG